MDLAATPDSAAGSTTAPQSTSVPPLNPRAVDGPYYQQLYGPGIKSGLSIETAELKFAHIRHRSVYGTIHINDEHGCVHTLYHRRSEEEAEKLLSPSGGFLSLSGPRYFLTATAPTFMYVTLYEVGIADPFLHQRVPLDHSRISSTETKSVSLGGEAELTVITPATLTDISLELYYPDSYNEWLVSGTVTANQTISQGNKTRSVPLFYRPIDDPMTAVEEDDVSPGRRKARISPDRKAFLAPLLFEKSSIEKRNRALLDAGFPSSGANPDRPFYNGVGSFHSIDVDLRFVNSVDVGKYCIVRGSLHYQFKCTHEHEAVFRASLKEKEPRLSTDEEGIEVVISLKPWNDIHCSMNGEPDECDHPLYVPPIEYIYVDSDSSDTDTDTEDGPMKMESRALG